MQGEGIALPLLFLQEYEMAEQSSPVLLELRGISKSFLGTRAVDGVDFSCHRGEIHGLVGENGAGKSTLMKVVAGIHTPDAGKIFLNGRECRLRDYAAARTAGIGFVYQELSLLPELTVAENMAMGVWPRSPAGLVDWKKIRIASQIILQGIGIEIDPDALVSSLPMAMRQMVEIGKVLSQESELIIFDEPTAPLSRDEVTILFGILRDLKQRGKGIVFISHRLDEVLSISDRITVMKDGQRVITDTAAAFNEEKLISSMVGRDFSEIFPAKREMREEAPPVFAFDGILKRSGKRVAFSVRKGEVLGIGGLQGQGQLELLQSIFGLGGCESLKLKIGDRTVSAKNPIQAIRHGIALVPENRNEEGVFLILSVLENLSASTVHLRKRMGFIRWHKERSVVQAMVDRLSIRISSVKQAAQSLSGGNMQKLVIGKWLIFETRVIVLLEPTKGVDVATKQQIYRLIRELADRGVVVILNTSDMLELIGACDRVLVMNHGFLTACLEGAAIMEENIMKASVSNENLLELGGSP
jgi:ABC-type sugar transport system ATPase subunit